MLYIILTLADHVWSLRHPRRSLGSEARKARQRFHPSPTVFTAALVPIYTDIYVEFRIPKTKSLFRAPEAPWKCDISLTTFWGASGKNGAISARRPFQREKSHFWLVFLVSLLRNFFFGPGAKSACWEEIKSDYAWQLCQQTLFATVDLKTGYGLTKIGGSDPEKRFFPQAGRRLARSGMVWEGKLFSFTSSFEWGINCQGWVENIRPGSGFRFFGFWSVTFLESVDEFFQYFFKNITFWDLSIGGVFRKFLFFRGHFWSGGVGAGFCWEGVVGTNPRGCNDFFPARGW